LACSAIFVPATTLAAGFSPVATFLCYNSRYRGAKSKRQQIVSLRNCREKRIAIKMNALISIVALVLGLSASAVFAQQNLIVNGSFETHGGGFQTFPGWNQIGPADNNSNYGVTNSKTSPDVAEQGTNYVYFHGHPTDSSQDCLGQTLTLTPGAQYIISYYMGTDGNTVGRGAEMWVAIGQSFGLDYSQDLLLTDYWPNSSTARPYQKFSNVYTATNPSPILAFHGIDATSSILVDNVSVTLLIPPLNVHFTPPNTLAFNWTSATAAYRLQTNSSILKTNWVTMTNVPVTLGSSNQIILPTPAGNRFYRLTLP
jgi:hypothetical protein